MMNESAKFNQMVAVAAFICTNQRPSAVASSISGCSVHLHQSAFISGCIVHQRLQRSSAPISVHQRLHYLCKSASISGCTICANPH